MVLYTSTNKLLVKYYKITQNICWIADNTFNVDLFERTSILFKEIL